MFLGNEDQKPQDYNRKGFSMPRLMGLGTKMQDTAGPQAFCFTRHANVSHTLFALPVETSRVSNHVVALSN